ncbi:apaG [Capsaspora owczarzaki ATCC 30864]|uniref:ApaG n=1 Tax=Capsaspora owczarzaki (strain ATCC 30864) TaxID=595528 RepID=A0A0D2VMC2_CAPO3|nr:apaG [Capsaspora owczarzaki ATCC 30864]KJE91302.1 apaG [Capsaspora owczarzaki ATCC 30864]|eukprot:XP_004349208.2 apaG [Capsaspora owczarzaki ATCC 30864]
MAESGELALATGNWELELGCLPFLWILPLWPLSPVVAIGRLLDATQGTAPFTYSPGQLFIHRLFGYRCVVIDYWQADLVVTQPSSSTSNATATAHPSLAALTAGLPQPPMDASFRAPSVTPSSPHDETTSITEPGAKHIIDLVRSAMRKKDYYIAVPDLKDRTERHTASFLFVAPEDMIPYLPIASHTFYSPILHEWFHALPASPPPASQQQSAEPTIVTDVVPSDAPVQSAAPAKSSSSGKPAIPKIDYVRYVPTGKLNPLRARTATVRQYSKVYVQTTDSIRVTVVPWYFGFTAAHNSFVWTVNLVIENLGDATVQLRRRHWTITDASGRMREVSGSGVAHGAEPVFVPNSSSSYEYTMGVESTTSHGNMKGMYEFDVIEPNKTSKLFVNVPQFVLESPPFTHDN